MEQNEQETIVIEETPDQTEQEVTETIDWKAKSDELAARLRRAEKALKAREESKNESKDKTEDAPRGKKETLDRLDRAILRVEKITEDDEVKLVEDIMRETGRNLESVIASKYFQSELKEIREAKATKDATPSGTKRSSQTPRDEVDYWIAKGEAGIKELSSSGNTTMLQKVVNAKMERAKKATMFTDTPVA